MHCQTKGMTTTAVEPDLIIRSKMNITFTCPLETSFDTTYIVNVEGRPIWYEDNKRCACLSVRKAQDFSTFMFEYNGESFSYVMPKMDLDNYKPIIEATLKTFAA